MGNKNTCIDNKTNVYMMDKLIRHINGYLKRKSYTTLLLEVAIQDGVIQIVRTIDVKDKKKL